MRSLACSPGPSPAPGGAPPAPALPCPAACVRWYKAQPRSSSPHAVLIAAPAPLPADIPPACTPAPAPTLLLPPPPRSPAAQPADVLSAACALPPETIDFSCGICLGVLSMPVVLSCAPLLRLLLCLSFCLLRPRRQLLPRPHRWLADASLRACAALTLLAQSARPLPTPFPAPRHPLPGRAGAGTHRFCYGCLSQAAFYDHHCPLCKKAMDLNPESYHIDSVLQVTALARPPRARSRGACLPRRWPWRSVGRVRAVLSFLPSCTDSAWRGVGSGWAVAWHTAQMRPAAAGCLPRPLIPSSRATARPRLLSSRRRSPLHPSALAHVSSAHFAAQSQQRPDNSVTLFRLAALPRRALPAARGRRRAGQRRGARSRLLAQGPRERRRARARPLSRWLLGRRRERRGQRRGQRMRECAAAV